MSARFVRQIPLFFYPGSKDIFLAVEAWPGPDPTVVGEACVRLTVSHPEPDRHIAIAMHVDEVFNLISTLLHAFAHAFLKDPSDVTKSAGGSSEPGGDR